MVGSELLYQSCKKTEGENSENSEVAAGMGLPRVNVALVVQPWCLGMAPPPSANTTCTKKMKEGNTCLYDGGDGYHYYHHSYHDRHDDDDDRDDHNGRDGHYASN